jgi:uncharacterized protein YdhG (YjbR/CyaY superfamily)
MPAKTASKEHVGFSADEISAMKAHATELRAQGKAGATRADGLQALLDSMDKMTPPDRALAQQVHATVSAVAPDLWPKTWYGMPAYADAAGKTIFAFKNSGKFKSRYSTLEFTDAARLDDGEIWPVSYALVTWSDEVEKRVAELITAATS